MEIGRIYALLIAGFTCTLTVFDYGMGLHRQDTFKLRYGTYPEFLCLGFNHPHLYPSSLWTQHAHGPVILSGSQICTFFPYLSIGPALSTSMWDSRVSHPWSKIPVLWRASKKYVTFWCKYESFFLIGSLVPHNEATWWWEGELLCRATTKFASTRVSSSVPA